jgi:hypothetical protein
VLCDSEQPGVLLHPTKEHSTLSRWKLTWIILQIRRPSSAVGIATALRAGRSGDLIPVGARFSASVQTDPGAHPASCTMGTGSFAGVKSGRGVTLTPHLLLVPWSRKGRTIPLLPLWAIWPVQSLSACTRVHFTFTFYITVSVRMPQEKYSVRVINNPVNLCCVGGNMFVLTTVQITEIHSVDTV